MNDQQKFEFLEKISKDMVHYNQRIQLFENLDFGFVNEYKDRFSKSSWNSISFLNKNIKRNFVKKFNKYIDFDALFFNKHVSDEFLAGYIRKVNIFELISCQYHTSRNFFNILRSTTESEREFDEELKKSFINFLANQRIVCDDCEGDY